MSRAVLDFYKNHFILMIVIGIAIGAYVGGAHPKLGTEVGILGEAFLASLKMIVVPLVLVTMIAGVVSLGDVKDLRGIGGRTIAFYMLTTLLAVSVGLVLVNIIKPGAGSPARQKMTETAYSIDGKVLRFEGAFENPPNSKGEREYVLTLADQKIEMTDEDGEVRMGRIRGSIRSVVEEDGSTIVTVDRWVGLPGKEEGDEPETARPVATGKGFETDLAIAAKVRGKEKRTMADTLKEVLLGPSGSGGGLVPRNLFRAMIDLDLLPLIVFSLIFGGILLRIGDAGKPVRDFVISLEAAIMKFVHLIIFFTPFGVLGLIANSIGKAGGWVEFLPELKKVALYSGTVIAGLAVHGFVVLPLILFLVGRRNPLAYARGMTQALLTAFSTASSSGTLPVTMESVTVNNRVSERTASFVLPLGATINMDGTALYEAVAVLFIAQCYGVDLTTGQQIIVLLTATLAAIGAAGIPEAGLVTMVIVLKAVDLPIEGIGLILMVDWFLDRCRTTVNVWGDAIGSGVIDRFEGMPEPEPSAG